MPKAVSDSSTLIHSAGIGRLTLLMEFYEKIIISPAVWKEVVEEGFQTLDCILVFTQRLGTCLPFGRRQASAGEMLVFFAPPFT